MKKSVLAWCLAASMVFSMTPTAAFAEDFTAGDTAEFPAEASEDAGDSAAETSEAEAAGDGIVEMNDGEESIAEADETENAQDGITEAGDAENAASADVEGADGFSDSEEEVLFADGETAAADLADADSTTGLNVAYHTVDEIVAYLKNNGATLEDVVTYDTEPELTAPYSAGVLSEETKNSALAMLNNVRYIAGLSQVALDDDKADSQQAASIISAANGTISHYPTQPEGMSDDLYKLGYSACGKANLAAGNATLNKAIVQGWMDDSDSYNISCVGHRRWCLYPYMGKTAFGAVTGTDTDFGTYYSMYVFDTSGLDNDETLVAWPAQNMPLEYFGDDYAWSLSVGKEVTASAVTVTLTRGTDSWTFSSSDSTDGDFYVNNENYGQKGCIIFRPSDITYADGDVFTVTVTGLDQTVSYTVTFFKLDQYWHTHTYSSYTASLSEDCTTLEVVYTCSCGESQSESLPVTTTVVTEAGCTTYGKVQYTAKSGLTSKRFSGTYYISSLGHDYSAESVSDNAAEMVCSRCGATKTVGVVTAFYAWWKTDGASTSDYNYRWTKAFQAGDVIDYYMQSTAGGTSEVTTLDEDYVVESSDPEVVEVSQEPGYTCFGELTMKKGGKVTLTVYPKLNPSLTKTISITVYCSDDDHVKEVQNEEAATCTEAGYTGDTVCTVCGKTIETGTEIAATGHTTELQNVKAATCTEAGYTGDTVCTVCGETLESGTTIAALGHKTTTINAKDVTCTEDGYSGDEICTVCGTTVTKGKTISATGHTTELQNAKAATCTEDGYSGDEICTVCGDTVTKGKTISATGHTTTTVNAVEATCTEEGYTGDEICSTCQKTVTPGSVTAALGHTTETQNAKAATCTEDGYTGDKYCTVCGKLVETGSVISAAGHQTEGSDAKEATCTEDGYTGRGTCKVCGETVTGTVIPARGHITELQNDKAATCTEAGYTGDEICTVCGITVTTGEETAALGHTEKLVNAKDADCQNEGYTGDTYCSVCGELLKSGETISVTDHTAELQNAKAATCAAEGYTGDEICSVCGKTIKTGSTIAKTDDHTTELKNAKAATCAAEGYTGDEVCTVCGETIKTGSAIAKTDDHTPELQNAVAATCVSTGYTGDEVCAVCGEKVQTGTQLPATGNHTWDAGRMTTPATVEAAGVMTYTCQVCGMTKTEEIAKLTPTAVPTATPTPTTAPTATTAPAHTTHTWGSWIITKSATVLEKGEKQRTCTVCGEAETQEIAKKKASACILLAKGKQSGKNIKLTWLKYTDTEGAAADGYEVYGATCGDGSKYKLMKSTKSRSYTAANLKDGVAYKFYVKAYKMVSGKKVYLAQSPKIHVAMSSDNATNVKKISVKKTKISLAAGKTYTLKPTVTKQNKKKKLLKHVAQYRYYSSDTSIAKVNSKGKITAVAGGTCKIYVIANSGLWKAVTVTIK